MFLKDKIIYEDKYFLVYNKGPGINSLDISPLICHRLDKDTSGVLIIAKNQETKGQIQSQFKERIVHKVYSAIVLGKIEKPEIVEGFIFRDKKNKLKRRFLPSFNIPNFQVSGRRNERYSKTQFFPDQVFYKKIFKKSEQKDLNYFSFLTAILDTGRTHQIRVHLQSIHHPILGDKLYGGKIIRKISQKLKISRLLLHATEIILIHPKNHKEMLFKSPLPIDFQNIIKKLEE